MKIITLCGSLKFQKEMMEMAQKLAFEGNCVLTPTYPVLKDITITDKQIKHLKDDKIIEVHGKKITLLYK